MSKQSVILPIETKAREFHGKLFLASIPECPVEIVGDADAP